MEKDFLKTGTTTLGMVCKDGILLAADKKVTAGNLVSSTKFDKVIIINDSIAITTAGLVSDVQLLTKLIRAQIKLDELRRNKKIKIKEAANLLANLVYNNVRKMSIIQGITGFLMAGVDNEGFYLYELGIDGSLNRFDDFVADGSGMMFALGVLESHYKQDLTVEQAKEVAIKAISASMMRDTASGGGIDIVTITKEGTKKVYSKVLQQKLA